MKNRVLTAITVTLAMIASVLGGSVILGATEASASTSSSITMAMMGDVATSLGGSDAGDTWDSTWMADGTTMAQQNDGDGVSGSTGKNARIVSMKGTPAIPGSLSGTNFNPGTYNTLPADYSSSIYDVGGVLYNFKESSSQSPCCTFYDSRLIDSTDGGETWSTPGTSGFFPSAWGLTNFVKYGEGGAAPDVDNAQTYAYVYSNQDDTDNGQPNYGYSGDDVWLARVPLDELADLDSADYEYYTGGDGMDDSSWSSDSTDEVPIETATDGQLGPTTIVYNAQLGQYIMSSYRFNTGVTSGAETLYVASDPWGPYTQVMDDSFASMLNTSLDGAYLTWIFLDNNAWTSSDGTTMWATVQRQSAYNVGFVPVYFTDQPVTTDDAVGATNTGVSSSTTVSGYSGSGYMTGYGTNGDSTQFSVDSDSDGSYMIQFTYNTASTGSKVGLYVNGSRQSSIDFGDTDNLNHTWMTVTKMVSLTTGTNTIALTDDSADGDTGNFNLDTLGMALYSQNGTTIVNDDTTGTGMNEFDYSGGTWTYYTESPSTGAYDNDSHYSDHTNDYYLVRFDGTGITLYDIVNPGGGYGSAQICNSSGGSCGTATTIDDYAPTRTGDTQVYSISGLPSDNYTLKVTITGVDGTGGLDYIAPDVVAITTAATPTTMMVNDDTTGTGMNEFDYSGGTWTYYTESPSTGAYDNDSHYSDHTNDYYLVRFDGTGITLYDIVNPGGGYGSAQICNSSGGSCGTATTIDDYAPTRTGDTQVYSISGLPSDNYTLKVTITGVDGTGGLDYIAPDVVAITTAATPTTMMVNDDTTGTGMNEFDYSGGTWTYYTESPSTGAYDNDSHYSDHTNDYYLVRFDGTGITLYDIVNPGGGYGSAQICNSSGGSCGTATTIDDYAPTRTGDTQVYSVEGMTSGDYSLKVTITGVDGTGGLDYIAPDVVAITS